jgi:putative ABC transport system ATP-binding protein
MSDEVIQLEAVSRTYGEGEALVKALDSVDLSITRGEFTAVVGPSGSGKTTLLNLIGGLDRPTSGRLYLAGTPLEAMGGAGLSDFRRDHIGFIFHTS